MEPIKLEYENPATRRRARQPLRELVLDLIDLLSGPRGLLLVIGLFAMLVGPHQRNWIGGASMVVGGLIVEMILVLWLRRP